MKDSINMSWKKGMAFEADVNGFKIMVDATSEHGGSNRGPRPKPLMMVALAGCTAMDVVSILQKMRVELDDLNVRIEGELTDEHPKHFTRMHIIYEFKGKDLPEEKLKKAIDLSQERYCGVSVSYRMAMDISYEVVIKQ